MTAEELIGAIESMTVLELAELVKALQEKFGVSAAAPVAAAAPAAGGAAVVEEKTAFDVVLKSAGDKKIQVIPTTVRVPVGQSANLASWSVSGATPYTLSVSAGVLSSSKTTIY